MNQIKLLEATQGKPVWVLRRHDHGLHSWYAVFSAKPTCEEESWVCSFCHADFERFTGLRLNPGEYTRIRFGVSPV